MKREVEPFAISLMNSLFEFSEILIPILLKRNRLMVFQPLLILRSKFPLLSLLIAFWGGDNKIFIGLSWLELNYLKSLHLNGDIN